MLRLCSDFAVSVSDFSVDENTSVKYSIRQYVSCQLSVDIIFETNSNGYT